MKPESQGRKIENEIKIDKKDRSESILYVDIDWYFPLTIDTGDILYEKTFCTEKYILNNLRLSTSHVMNLFVLCFRNTTSSQITRSDSMRLIWWSAGPTNH